MKKFDLSEAKKNQLAAEITQQILDEANLTHAVNGERLQHLTRFPQVNQFLLFQVYQVWQLQVARFRHSYFDFDHPEVENQLQVLQNLLSRHITIKVEDMQPLLRNAVYNNLALLINPEESLKNFFFTQLEQVPRSRYEALSPFFHDFDFAVGSIQGYHEKQGLDTVDRDVFAVKLNKVLELYEGRGNNLHDYRASRLEALVGRPLAKLQEEDQADAKAREEAQARLSEEAQKKAKIEEERARKAAEAREEAAQAEEAMRRQAEEADARRRQTSFFDTLSVSAPVIDLDAPAEADEPIIVEATIPVSKVKKEKVAPKPAIEKVEKEVKAEKQETIAEKLASTRATVADKLKEAQETVADKFTSQDETIISKLGVNKAEEPTVSKPEPLPKTIEPKVEEKVPVEEVVVPKEPIEVVVEEKAATEEKVEAVKEEVNEKANSVLDRFSKQNDEPAEKEEQEEAKPLTVADRFRKNPETPAKPISNRVQGTEIIADDIPVHKQYQFVQKVFGGNHARFRAVIDKVNHAENADEVAELLNKYVVNSRNVKQGDPVVEEFANLMRGRF